MRNLLTFGLLAHAAFMAADYNPMELLEKPLDDFQPPVQFPVGTYVGQVIDYDFDKTKPKDTSKQPTNLVKVKICAVEPFPDVNAEELKDMLDQKGVTLKEIELRPLDFFLTPEAMYRFTEFTREHAKITMEEAPNGQEALEVLKAGRQFGFEIGLVENKREPSKPYHQVTRTFALP